MTDIKDESLDRSVPPKPGIPKDVSFPDYFEERLSNGMKVIVYERNDLPTVTVNIVARGGSFYDGAFPGLASMTCELLTKGTSSRNAIEIVEEIEFLGGSIGASSGWDSASAGISIISRHLEKAMDVLGDVVRNPVFPAEEIDRFREQRLGMILQGKSNPSILASNHFQKTVYRNHPYGNPPEGTEDSIQAMERDHFAGFHKMIFNPNNMFMIAVGDVSPERMMPLAERYFGDWQSGSVPICDIPSPESPAGIMVHIVERASAVQSSVIVGHVGIERKNADYITVTLMNTLLGGYFGSRLNLNLREAKGYTYGAASRFDGRMQAGPFSAGTEVRNDVTDKAIEEIIKEINRFVIEMVDEEELDSVKRYVTGNFPIQIETPLQVAQRILNIELYDLGKTYYNTFNSKVLAITPDDIIRVAKNYVYPDRLIIVASGRGSLLRNTLARFGSVEVFDQDGKLIPNI